MDGTNKNPVRFGEIFPRFGAGFLRPGERMGRFSEKCTGTTRNPGVICKNPSGTIVRFYGLDEKLMVMDTKDDGYT